MRSRSLCEAITRSNSDFSSKNFFEIAVDSMIELSMSLRFSVFILDFNRIAISFNSDIYAFIEPDSR